MGEFNCTDCKMPATRGWLGTISGPNRAPTNHDGQEALFLFCDKHAPPLWITMSDGFKEISIDELRVRSVMDP